MNIKYNKYSIWLKPFVESAATLINLNKISQVRGYKVKLGLVPKNEASITLNKSKYNINIRMWGNSKNKHEKKDIQNILDSLAHELAHITHWKHTPKHFRLQYKILLKFSKILEKEGITDHSKSFT